VTILCRAQVGRSVGLEAPANTRNRAAGRSSAAALLRHVCRLLKAHEQATGTVGCDLMEAISPMPSPKMNSAEKRLYAAWTEDLLIDSYFRYHHASYPIVHEAIFRDQVTRVRSNDLKVNTHWQTLYRMVLVTGAFMSSTDHTDSPVDMEIYKTINDTFSTLDFLSYGTLEGVQALALMVCDRLPSAFSSVAIFSSSLRAMSPPPRTLC